MTVVEQEQPTISVRQQRAEQRFADRLVATGSFVGPEAVEHARVFAGVTYGRGIADLADNYDDGVSRPEKRIARRINRFQERWGSDAVSRAFEGWRTTVEDMKRAHLARVSMGESIELP